jgi:predicted nucleotidyltransferase
MGRSDLRDYLRSEAREADELHTQSRERLIAAARRGAAEGLTQREIADALGRSQPEVSRLLRFHGSTPIGRALSRRRREAIALARSYGADNVRVFGSVARGEDDGGSDLDLLVDIKYGVGLFAIARLERDLEALLGAHVDVVPAAGLRGTVREQALSEAVPL